MKSQPAQAIEPAGRPSGSTRMLLGYLLAALAVSGCGAAHFDDARFQRQRQLLGAAWADILCPDECRPVMGPPQAQPWAAQAQDRPRGDDPTHECWWYPDYR